VYGARWSVRGDPVRTEDGREYRRGTECGLTFDLESKPELPWVKVEAIKVVVTEYQPMPRHLAFIGAAEGPIVIPHPYRAEVNHPAVAKAAAFVATYLQDGKPSKDVSVRLERGKPEAFALRVGPKKRARVPGIYTFFCEVTVSSRDTVSNQRVGQALAVYFD
jgi:hypothetical protein